MRAAPRVLRQGTPGTPLSAAERVPNLGHRQLLDLFGELDELLGGNVVPELLVVG